MSTPPFLDLPATAHSRRLATARGTFASLVATPPDGLPCRGTALLVPGFTGGKEDFIALLDPLARRGYRVVSIDQRGQYETPGPEDDRAAYARSALVADLWAVHDQLAPDEPLHLVGHSYGGLVVRSAALDALGRLASLTLMSTGPAAISAAERERLLTLEAALVDVAMPHIWQAMRERDARAGVTPPADPRIAEYLRRRWLANTPLALAEASRQLRGEPDRTEDLAARVAEGLRALVLSGTRDYAWPVPWQAETARRLGVPHVIVDGAAHSPNVERPETTAKNLADFWDTAAA